MDVFIVQNRVVRLSKGLFRETYSIKEFTFDSHIAYQSFKLTAELHLTRKETLFDLENLKLTKKSYDNISKTLFIPYPKTKFVKTPLQSSLCLHFFKDFQSSKSCLIRFGIRFPEVCFKKFVNFELSSQIYKKIKEYLLKNQQRFTIIRLERDGAAVPRYPHIYQVVVRLFCRCCHAGSCLRIFRKMVDHYQHLIIARGCHANLLMIIELYF